MKRLKSILMVLLLTGCTVVIDETPPETNLVETPEDKKPNTPVVDVLPTPTGEQTVLSNNAFLASLESDQGVLAPNFSKEVFEYQLLLTSKTTELQLKAKTEHPLAHIDSELTLSLTSPETNHPLEVKAQNGDQQIYVITIIQPQTVTPNPSSPETPSQPTPSTPEPSFVHLPTPDSVTYVEGLLFVNKKIGLPSSYNPGEDPVAGAQIRQLIKDMQEAGLNVRDSYSGFRSFSQQKRIFENYVKKDGVEKAETYSARPGFSEHQTGLTFDLFTKDNRFLGNGGRDVDEVAWLATHAASYGFIVRYPAGKTAITGYRPEPWHLRYVGERAHEIQASGLTLEEFFNMPGGDYVR